MGNEESHQGSSSSIDYNQSLIKEIKCNSCKQLISIHKIDEHKCKWKEFINENQEENEYKNKVDIGTIETKDIEDKEVENRPSIEYTQDIVWIDKNKENKEWNYLFHSIFEEKKDINLRDRGSGKTFLHLISSNEEISSEMVIFLFEQNADVSIQDEEFGMTPFHYLCLNEKVDLKMIKIYLHCKADIHCKDNYNRTPLHFISSNPKVSTDILNLFIQSNVKMNLKEDYNEKSPFHFIVSNPFVNSDMINLFLENGGKFNIKDDLERTPFHLSCSNPNVTSKIITPFLNKEIDVNLKDKNGRTPLLYLCENKNLTSDSLLLLLQSGADPNLKESKFGASPFHLFCCFNNKSASKKNILLLLLHGADPFLKLNTEKASLKYQSSIQSGFLFEAISDLKDGKLWNFDYHCLSSPYIKKQIFFFLLCSHVSQHIYPHNILLIILQSFVHQYLFDTYEI
eukprot:TRINITY_DN5482_c0_g1_i1.p1 TRINITY_DN5482_c0_g1~~TRINITY_DN5482_c0_g1_i1.p1  ORF type:complete len:455 (+),score=99.43 TRINITY_DN5482_c0_g1_i1:27-1391(+)